MDARGSNIVQNTNIRCLVRKALTIAGTATAFSLRFRLHYKAACAAGVIEQGRFSANIMEYQLLLLNYQFSYFSVSIT